MPDNKNNDLINDILNEVDSNRNASESEELPENETEIQSAETDETAPAEEFVEIVHEESPESSDDGFSDIEETLAETSQEQPKIRKAPARPPVKKKKKKKKKRKRSRLPGVLILTTFIFAVSICLSLVIIAFGKDMLGIGKSENTHLIIIPEGATTEEISFLLRDEGIIKSPKCFQLFSRLRKSDSGYIAGEHFIRPNMAYETIINTLTSVESEDQEVVEITFPEGITIYDAALILDENGVCSSSDFIFYFNSGGFGLDFESRIPTDSSIKFNRMEGYVFPDTYFFYTNMEAEQVCQKIYYNFDGKMTEERYKKMDELGLTLDQLITFASIVQKEAANTETMTMVASVFWNRLNNPDIFPKLQSDPTSNYANDVIRPHMDVYDKTIIDAYNTYEGVGLPPGAICNPGLEAIDAVLENFQSDYFYFIANIYTGVTEFSVTLEEHEMKQAQIENDVAEYIASSEAAEREAAMYE